MKKNTTESSAVHSKLSRVDLLSMAVGQIIGVGIMTLTGIAIGFTGRSVNLAYLAAALIVIFSAIPQIFIGGTANFIGGQYSQIAFLSGQRLAGVQTFINLAMSLGISMYTLSFCDYFLSLIPGVNSVLISLVVLTVIIGMHVVGVKQAARLQNIMCIILALSIATYIVLGLGNVPPGYFSGGELFSGGVTGFLLASVFLTFAVGGATYVVNFSSEAENPIKDIPFVIIASTLGVVIVYALMATVAAGVLPVAEVINKPLSVSAAVFLPPWAYTFFIVGGAMFALLTTLNFSIGMMTFPIKRACEDGWLPKKLASCNKRFGTPHWILLMMFLIGFLPILFNINLNTIANSTVILTTSIRGVIAFSAMHLPKRMSTLWERSKFHVGNTVLNIICIVTIVIALLSVALLIVTSATAETIGNLVILACAVVFALIRNQHVSLQPSYKET